jgi:hypothetical protein
VYTEIELYPGEARTAPPSPLWACCISSIGPLCQHAPTIHGPAHFAPVDVPQVRAGMVLDFQKWATGDVFYMAVETATEIAPGCVAITFVGGGYWTLSDASQVRVAQPDAVTRLRMADVEGARF